MSCTVAPAKALSNSSRLPFKKPSIKLKIYN